MKEIRKESGGNRKPIELSKPIYIFREESSGNEFLTDDFEFAANSFGRLYLVGIADEQGIPVVTFPVAHQQPLINPWKKFWKFFTREISD